MARFACAWFALSIILFQPSAGWTQPASSLTLSDRAQIAVMVYLNDKQLHEELKVTAEQVAQLTAFRDKWTGGRATAISIAERRKQLAAILSPAQVQRLEQIGIQNLTKSPKGLSPVIVGSIGEALKLSAEQKQQVNNLATLEKVLTPDQRKTWDGLIGQPFLAQLVPQFPGGFGGGGKSPKGGGFGTADSLMLRRLQVPDVQKELKFNTDQEKKLAEIADKFTKDRAEKLSAANARTLATTVTKEAQALLTPEQDKRLKQIEAQKAMGPNPIAIFDYAPAKAQLNLVPEHLEQLAAIRKDGEQALNKIFLSGQPYEKIADAIKQSKQATYEKLVGTLSPAQRETLKNVTGTPYTGAWQANLLMSGFPTKNTSGFTPAPKDRNDSVGRFSVLSVPRSLTMPTLRKELKLAENQSAIASLTPEQHKRGTEILFQNMDYLAGPMYLFIYKDMADGLNLAADQKAKLGPLAGKAWQDQLNRNGQNLNGTEPLRISEETRREQIAQLGKILTAEQQKQMNALMGEPFANQKTLAQEHYVSLRNAKGGTGFGPGGTFGGTNPQHPSLNVVRHELVSKELQIMPAQLDKLEALAKIWTEESVKLNAGEQRRTLAAKIDADIAAVLSANQRGRFQQIELQRKINGATFKTTVILDSAIAGQLKLTSQQNETLKGHFAEANQTLALLSREMGAAGKGPSPFDEGTTFGGGKGTAASAEYTKTRNALRQAFDNRALALLTTDQQQSWRDLLGQPFAGIAEVANAVTTFGGKKNAGGQE
jgi:hypothetical protein